MPLAVLLLGAALLLAAIALLAVILLWSRRGDQRCPYCRYTARDADARCPECGRPRARDSALLRLRRRWGPAAVSLPLALLGVYLIQVSLRLRAEPATAWIPTSIVVIAAPVELANHPLTQAAWRRSRSLWRWQESILARRELAAIPEPDLESWLWIRTDWPADLPMPISLAWHDNAFSSIAGPRRLDVRSTDDRGIHLTAGIDSWDPRSFHGEHRDFDWDLDDVGGSTVSLPPMPIGRHDLALEFTYSARGGARRTFRRTYTIQVWPRPEDVITPIATPALADTLAHALRASAWNEDPSHPTQPAGLRIDLDNQAVFDALYRNLYPSKRLKDFPDPEIAGTLTILDGDRVLLDRPFENWFGCSISSQTDDLSALLDLALDPATGAWRCEILDRLTVRLRGDPALAVRSLHAPSCWSGEITIPLRRVLDQTPDDR